MLPFTQRKSNARNIVIVGLGGAGAHILRRFSGSSAENVRLCIMSPDERLAEDGGNVEFLQLGPSLNRGLGSGGDPDVGRSAFEESREQITELLKEAHLLVMVAGLGGGTGSGAAPLLAQMAAEAGIFLVSVIVMPFTMEGTRRRRQAESALDAVSAASDIVFCFENDYMEELFDGKNKLQDVYAAADTLLAQTTASIPLMANSPGLINLGLDELMTALRNNDSRCIYGSGKGFGVRRAEQAAKAALASPLVAYHDSLRFAHTVIVHVAGGNNMSLTELRTALETVRAGLPQPEEGEEEVRLFFGASVKPHLGDEIRVSLTASIDAVEFATVVREEKEAAATPPPVIPEPEAEEEAGEEPDAPAEEPAAEEGYEAPEETGEDVPEEQEEELFETPEEEPVPQPAPEPMSFFGTAAVQQSLFDLAPEPEEPQKPEPTVTELPHRGRSLFAEEEPPRRMDSYSPEAARRRMADRGDIDTPPSLRNNDLRDMFPDN